MWHRDEVLTSRMLFYLRVIPTCAGLIPAHMIRDKVASIMFLYPFYIPFHSIPFHCCICFFFALFINIFYKNIVVLSTNKIPTASK
jgi:hypothetical protein